MSTPVPGPAGAAEAPDKHAASIDRILELLRKGQMKLEGLLPNSSNYTFLATIKQTDLQCLAVYKPQRGERPLWDFPRGTLCMREYATFLVAMAIGWVFVPPTVLRRGPHGMGAVQLYIDAEPESNFFTMRDEFPGVFQRFCAFDYVVNNADRKGGHCLLGKDGHIWGIDHGITFNADFKLRTVIWDWAGEPLPDELRGDLATLRDKLAQPGDLPNALGHLLEDDEMDALRRRLDSLLQSCRFPEPHPDLPNVPWPLV